MDNELLKPEVLEKPKKSLKKKLYLILVLILIGAGIYGYYWVKSTNDLRVEASTSIEKADKYDGLMDKIRFESDRCKTFITQSQGDFGSFEYCKRFIDWSNSVN